MRVDEQAKKKIRFKVSKEELESAKSGLEWMKSEWAEATAASSSGKQITAAEKARAVKAKGEEVQKDSRNEGGVMRLSTLVAIAATSILVRRLCQQRRARTAGVGVGRNVARRSASRRREVRARGAAGRRGQTGEGQGKPREGRVQRCARRRDAAHQGDGHAQGSCVVSKQTQVAAATHEWEALSEEVPKMVKAIETPRRQRCRASKLPQGSEQGNVRSREGRARSHEVHVGRSQRGVQRGRRARGRGQGAARPEQGRRSG